LPIRAATSTGKFQFPRRLVSSSFQSPEGPANTGPSPVNEDVTLDIAIPANAFKQHRSLT